MILDLTVLALSDCQEPLAWDPPGHASRDRGDNVQDNRSGRVEKLAPTRLSIVDSSNQTLQDSLRSTCYAPTLPYRQQFGVREYTRSALLLLNRPALRAARESVPT